MAESAAAERFQLDLPARPEHVATARLFAATLARIMGLGEDDVAEVKLAASEAMSLVVVAGQAATATVVADVRPDRIDVSVGPIDDLPADADGIDALGVVDALFPGAAATGGTLRFSVPR